MYSRPGDSLQFSPSSDPSYSLTPPNLQESEEESSYVSHTQHLVEVMEERIKQVIIQTISSPSIEVSNHNCYCSYKLHIVPGSIEICLPEGFPGEGLVIVYNYLQFLQKNLKKFEVKPTRSLVTGNVAGKKEVLIDSHL